MPTAAISSAEASTLCQDGDQVRKGQQNGRSCESCGPQHREWRVVGMRAHEGGPVLDWAVGWGGHQNFDTSLPSHWRKLEFGSVKLCAVQS